jgi:TolB-like protein
MGEVYLARDERLERDVALKVLPSGILTDAEARKRFRKEALTLSKLNHPNIATVFDFDTQDGVDFLVMEYVPGTTLDRRLAEGPLSEEEVARLGDQLAEGLAAAHQERVVHRDLKPGNLRVTPEGRLKILDFGLAKMARPVTETAATMSLTGGISGTVPYMAPEQLREEPLDGRTDVHAAGAVLYEMATGLRPFRNEQQAALIDAILNQKPDPPRKANPGMSGELETVILKALEKAPGDRYQSAQELREDLRRWSEGAGILARPKRRRRQWPVAATGVLGAVVLAIGFNLGGIRDRLIGTGAAETSLAVLPCINASGNPEDETFSDGMTENLITHLSKVRALRVINPMTMLHYKNTAKSSIEIANEVRATAILQSQVQQAGDEIQLSTQLIDPETDEIIWADQYSRDLGQILNLSNDIVVQVARSLDIKLSPAEEALFAVHEIIDKDAWRAFQRGKELLRNRTAQNIESSVEFFREAIAIDPTFAFAWCGLAECYLILSNPFFQQEAVPYREKMKIGREWGRRAKNMADRALSLDPNLPEAYMVKKDFARALEINPNHAWTHYYYSHHLSYLGEIDKAVAEIQTALDLDPGSYATNVVLAQKLTLAREFDRARAQIEEVMALNPDHPGIHAERILLELSVGDYEAAGRANRRFVELLGGDPDADSPIYEAAAGKIPVDTRVLSLVEDNDLRGGPAIAAVFYAILGESDRALTALEEAVDIQDFRLQYVWYPFFDAIRADPRYDAIIQGVRSIFAT